MVSEGTSQTAPPAKQQHGFLTFFRESGWLMIATMAGGALMFAVHSIAQKMPKAEYGVFTTLLQIISLMGIPAVGLQSVFAQQAAAALTPKQERELAGTFRAVLRGTFLVWLVMAAGVWWWRQEILTALKIADPAALWLAVAVGLIAVWRPIAQGVLQGRQNFLWLGNIMIADGVGRFAAVCLIVGWLAHQAAGAVAAVLVGMITVGIVGFWRCADCLRGPGEPMHWGGWLRRVCPLTLGMGVSIFMLSADMIFVQRFFSKDETGYYAAAGMIGRALVYFTAPVAAVMFPKLARSKATGEKSNALFLAVAFTALAGIGAAVGCTLLPKLPLQIVRYDVSYLEFSAPLIPWFGWCMLPLTLATVLLNNLMATSQFRAVPWLIAVATGYGLTLYFRHDSFIQVVQTIGLFGLLLLGVTAWFTWGKPRRTSQPQPDSAGR